MNRYERRLHHQKNTTNTTGNTVPQSAEGASGDVTIRNIAGQIRIYAKYGQTWYGRDLGPTVVLGETNKKHVQIGSGGMNIKDGTVSIASFGDTLRMGKDSTTETAFRVASDGTTSIGTSTTKKVNISTTGVLTVDDILLNGKIVLTGSGDGNICVGTDNEDRGTDNVLIGSSAGSSTSLSGVSNVCIGTQAGEDLTTGEKNVLIGYHAGLELSGVSTGSGATNVCIGFEAGNALLGTVAGNGVANVLIGYRAQASSTNGNQQIVLGESTTGFGNATITVGSSSGASYLELNGDTSWGCASDERFKENIITSTVGLSFINDLRPVTYNWKKKKDAPSDTIYYEEGSDEPCLGHSYGNTLYGFIAQEVKVAIDNHSEIKKGFKMWKQHDNGVQAVADGNLIPVLTKAIQELSAKIDTMQTEIDTLKG